MRIPALLFSAAALLGFGASARGDDLDRPQLKEIWSLSGFQDPESVVFDPREGVFYVSNMNGAADAMDGNGYISKVSADGRLLDKAWATGLNAPKGLTISGRKLYVTDIDALVEITFSNQELKRLPGPGAKFLNDVAADALGRIYVSDMLTDAIYRYQPGVSKGLELWVRDPRLAGPNGVLAEKDRLVVASWGHMTNGFETDVPGHLVTVTLRTHGIATLGNGAPVGNLDGLEPDGHGNYFVTDWMAGKLLVVAPSGDFITVRSIGEGAADLTYLDEDKILVIPVMKEGRLICYEVN
jgi:sugar lactone lactonase YvrE